MKIKIAKKYTQKILQRENSGKKTETENKIQEEEEKKSNSNQALQCAIRYYNISTKLHIHTTRLYTHTNRKRSAKEKYIIIYYYAW